MTETTLFYIMLLLQLATLGVLMSRQKPLRLMRSSGTKPVYVDTSVLIDGRLLPVVQAGFGPAKLVVPRSVVAELQLLADGSDNDKRARARHGLDVLSRLQEITSVTLIDDKRTGREGVDDRLLHLAKKHDGAIMTIDFNLAKVAKVEGIDVLNVNELAQQLRMSFLPGEKVTLSIVQKGNDAHQGVGYLADGTMVVVEQASAEVGKSVEVEFTRSLQTVAGRMLFAKKVGQTGAAKPKHTTGTKPAAKQQQRRRRKTPEDNLVDLANR